MKVPKEKKLALLYKYGCQCAYCGKEFDIEQCSRLVVEHKVPVSRGGSNDLSNLTLSCRPCNSKKGTKTLIEYREYLKQDARRKLDSLAVVLERWTLCNPSVLSCGQEAIDKQIEQIAQAYNLMSQLIESTEVRFPYDIINDTEGTSLSAWQEKSYNE